MTRRIWSAVLISLAASGCSLFAGKADYADYRAIRLAPDADARAQAMQSYVSQHPHGQWVDDVQAERKSDDAKSFEAGKDSRAGLEAYLRAHPDGEFTAQARSRLQAIGLIDQQKKAATEQAAQLAETRRVRADELRRTWLGRFMGYWLKTLVELHGWGEPIPEVAQHNPQFSRAFGAQPRPRCTQDECVKYYSSQYAVPVPGGNRIERTLSLLLRLRMKGGKLERAELLLPERGFSRWYELENRRPISDGDAEARKTAVAWAIERALPDLRALGEGIAEQRTTASALPTIVAPAIGPTGETIDTSIEAPTDPQNRVSGEDNAGIGVQTVKPAPSSVDAMVKPEAPAPASDMEFAPMGVGKQGQKVEVPNAPAAPAASGGDTQAMTFEAPLAVPKQGGAAAPAASAAQPTTVEAQVAPVVKVFSGAGVTITLFAAGSGEQNYDGMVIEHVAGKAGKAAASPKAAAAAPAPTSAKPTPSAAAAPAASKPTPSAAQPPSASKPAVPAAP